MENHEIKDCKVSGKLCVHCGEKDQHHRTLCPRKFKISETPTTVEDNTESEMVAVGETVIMKTATVTVNGSNTSATTRAFLDCGSSRTYIPEELTKEFRESELLC